MRDSKPARVVPAMAGIVLFAAVLFAGTNFIQTVGSAEPENKANRVMNNARLDELIRRIDSKVQGRPGFWRLTVEKHELLVITDEAADRMRIITPVVKAEEVDPKILYRLLQANFDTALDARYSIAKETLWSAFIHPLSTLGDAEFLTGLGQVVNLASTYGTTFSSGLLMFKGGDSGEEQSRELIERLLKKGLEI